MSSFILRKAAAAIKIVIVISHFYNRKLSIGVIPSPPLGILVDCANVYKQLLNNNNMVINVIQSKWTAKLNDEIVLCIIEIL